MRRVALLALTLAVLASGLWLASPASAQIPGPRRTPAGQPAATPVNQTDPVAFTADEVQYDRDNALVTATGNVEAWQNDHILRADKITFDRNTNVAAATGHVTIIEPDGQVLFSDYAELTEGMREGVLRGMRAILAENGKLVANGARRVEGKINEMSRAVYTTCDLCKTDPTRPPKWQIRARSAVQDTENKTIEYRDAVLDIFGVPVLAVPYFWHVDPSSSRASGFLTPSFGYAKHLGAFLQTPYYWVIDDQSDATFVPNFNTANGFNLNTEYRRRFNDGTLTVDTGVGFVNGLQGDIFAKGRFSYDDTWRYGFDIARASNATYLRDYRVTHRADVLTTNLYLEGFGSGAWTKLDATAYQGVVSTISQARLPFVLPRYQYSYFGEVDRLGGRISFDTINFNVLRGTGTDTQRAAATLAWNRPAKGLFGEVYNLTLQSPVAGYVATSLNQNPNYFTISNSQQVRAQPTAALKMSLPFVHDGEWGTQIIEPIGQVIVSPGGTNTLNLKIPNEDSIDAFNFSDANLFAINKFPGLDRLEGGVRANVALRANWRVGGGYAEGLIGQSYRTNNDNVFPIGSGLEHTASDVVARTTLAPSSFFDVTGRARFDHRTWNVKFADLSANAGPSWLRLSTGYFYNVVNPYSYYNQSGPEPTSFFQHRNEITFGASAQYNNWKLSTYVRRNINNGTGVTTGARGTYEDECVIFDVIFNKRYTSLAGDNGSTLVLFQITLKTVGQFGFHAF